MRTVTYIIFVFLFLCCYSYGSDNVPKNFLKFKDLYIKTMNEVQPAIIDKTIVAGQIEQETCYSLNSKTCQSPYSEIKSSWEYGFGFGQITITDRFNVFNDLKNRFKELKDQKQEDRYNPKYQMIALFLQDKYLYQSLSKYTCGYYNNFAFMLSAYNGGLGGLLRDIKICSGIKDCNPRVQFDNVEKYSQRSKVPSVYKKSFFEINREYVRNIMLVRKFKYEKYLN